MALPRLGLWVGAGLLLTATSVLAQGGGTTPPAGGPSGIAGADAPQSGADAPSAAPAPQTDAPANATAAPAAGGQGAAPAEATPDAGSATGEAAEDAQTPGAQAPGAELPGAETRQAAQPPRQLPFVTLDQARLFNQSRYGARLAAELGERQAGLAAENRRIEAELADKEKALTERRAKLSAEDFRRFADDFNAEVERHRAEQAAKEREIYQIHERNRALFQDLANQAMAGLLRERGALAIIAEEAIVMGFLELDITEDAIARLDALVGDGAHLPQPGDPDPDPDPDPAQGGAGQGDPDADAGNQTPDQTSD